VIGIIVALAAGVDNATGFVPTFGILGITTMFVVTNAALIVHWYRERARGVRRSVVGCVVVPIIGIITLAVPFWSDFQPGQVAPYSYLPWFYLALLAIGVSYLVYLRRSRPAMVARETVNPDLWELDQRYPDMPGRDQVMLDMLYDIQTTVGSYPEWQQYLREITPPTLDRVGAKRHVRSSPPTAPGPTSMTCPPPSCTCWTPVTSRPPLTTRTLRP
jgi:hypothetical protein